MRKRKGRSTALFLVFCMVLSMMSAIPARAEEGGDEDPNDVSGLVVASQLDSYQSWNEEEEVNKDVIIVDGEGYPAWADWENQDENGNPTAGDRMSYANGNDISISDLGSALWIDYIDPETGVKTPISAENITKVGYSENNPDEGTVNWEEKDGLIENYSVQTSNGEGRDLVLFKPNEPGYYCFTYNDSELIIHVDYPAIGFYSEPDRDMKNLCSKSNCIGESDFNYNALLENKKLKQNNVIYVNLYGIEGELSTNDCDLEFWGVEGEFQAKDYMSVAPVDGETGWYTITFNKAVSSKGDGFTLTIHTEDAGDAWLNGTFPQSGLVVLDNLNTYEEDGCEKIYLDEDGRPLSYEEDEEGVRTPGDPIGYVDCLYGSAISISDPALWIDYVDFATGEKTHITADDIDKVKYSENNPDEEPVENWEEKDGLIDDYSIQTSDGDEKQLVWFKPDAPGYYCFTYNEDELVVRVVFPEVGFYSAPDQTKNNLYLADGPFWDAGVTTGFICEDNQESSTIYVNVDPSKYNASDIQLDSYTLNFYSEEIDDNKSLEGTDFTGEDSGSEISQYMSVKPVEEFDDWYEITFKKEIGDFWFTIEGQRNYINEETGELDESSPTSAMLWGSFRQSGLYVTCDGEYLYTGEDTLHYPGGIQPETTKLKFVKVGQDENGKIENKPFELTPETKITIRAQRLGEDGWHRVTDDCEYKVTDGALEIGSYYQQDYEITVGEEGTVRVHPYMETIEFFNTGVRPDDPDKITNRICKEKVNQGKAKSVYVLAYRNDDDAYAANMAPDFEGLEIKATLEDGTDVTDDYIDIKWDDRITKMKEPDEDGAILGYDGYPIEITDKAEKDFDITVTTTGCVPDPEQENEVYLEHKNTLSVKINKRSSLKVATAPKKTTYTEGEKFDPTGMAVELVYEDKTTDSVKIEDCKITPEGALTTKDTSVTVEYLGLKATQKITVKAKQQPTTEQPTTQQPTTQAAQPSTEGTVLSSQETGEKAEFTVTSDNGANPTVAYKKTTDKKEKTVKIPDKVVVNGVTYKVTSIADNAFKGNKTITKVAVGSNITSIGKNAFASCTKLKSITIPKNVTTVGDNAFKGCTALTKVTLPAKTKKIGKNAFNGCKKISKVTFKGTSVTKIEEGAFRKCSALKSVTIPKNVTEIGKDAFRDCKKLKTVTIKGTKLKKIGKNVFKNLPKNVTIKVPKNKKAAYKKLLKKAGYKGKVK